jgi:hypothetical protein
MISVRVHPNHVKWLQGSGCATEMSPVKSHYMTQGEKSEAEILPFKYFIGSDLI